MHIDQSATIDGSATAQTSPRDTRSVSGEGASAAIMIERSGPPQHRAATDSDEDEDDRRPGEGARECSVVVAEQVPDDEVPHTSDDDSREEGETAESESTPEADEWPRARPNPELGG